MGTSKNQSFFHFTQNENVLATYSVLNICGSGKYICNNKGAITGGLSEYGFNSKVSH